MGIDHKGPRGTHRGSIDSTKINNCYRNNIIFNFQIMVMNSKKKFITHWSFHGVRHGQKSGRANTDEGAYPTVTHQSS